MIWLVGFIVAIAPSIWIACEGRVSLDREGLTVTPYPTYFQNPSDSSCKCGQKGAARIVGGNEVTPTEYPWHVILLNLAAYNSHFCNGSLITTQWVLSAAHCFTTKTASDIGAAVGYHDVTKRNPYMRGYRVVQLIVHELYNIGTPIDNDIAVLKMQYPARLNQGVSPICLPFNHKDDTWSGKTGSMSGWGRTSTGQLSRVLKEYDLILADKTNCNSNHGHPWAPSQITENMVCGKGNKAVMCNGDSGGPLVWRNSANGFYFQVGIASFVNDCGRETGVGVFTKVQNYLDWIKAKTGAGAEMCVP